MCRADASNFPKDPDQAGSAKNHTSNWRFTQSMLTERKR
jgi:hypothetical protein